MSVTVVYSPAHALHTVDTGSWVGVEIPTEEVGERAERIRTVMEGSGRVLVGPAGHDDEVLLAVHEPAMVDYMRTAHDDWVSWGYDDEPGQPNVVGYAFPTPGLLGGRPLRLPRSPGARAGVYAMDTMTPIGPGTFAAARAAVDVAQTAAVLATTAGAAYALCRPPGHHAGPGFFGGSCYLNNAAVAAEAMLRTGMGRVAIVDVDAHHGNGTQEIFYGRGDVVYTSIHVDPAEGWFPHFVGHADERGSGHGAGANLNLPLAPGTGDAEWLEALDIAIDLVDGASVDGVVVSLGVDAEVSDPESPLRVTEFGYTDAGRRIASLDLPTVFVQEGGYVLDTIGGLVDATLGGFEALEAMDRE